MHFDTSPPDKRIARKPTRTGCRTCRIRRIKCDEARPVCKRCSSTGRKCDGYERNVLISNGQTQRPLLPSIDSTSRLLIEEEIKLHFGLTSRVPPLISPLTPYSRANDYERLAFSFFQITVTPKLNVQTPRSRLSRLALQLSQSTQGGEAVFLGLAALGGIYRNLVQLTHAGFSRTDVTDEKAVELYCKSLRAAQRLIERIKTTVQDDLGIRMESVLMSCLLLLTFEMARENSAEVLNHLRFGKRLLTGLTRQSASISAELRELNSAFTILELECAISRRDFETSTNIFQPVVFMNPDDARPALDDLLASSHKARAELVRIRQRSASNTTTELCAAISLSRVVDLQHHGELSARLHNLTEMHSQWLFCLETLFHDTHRASTPSILLMEIQHLHSAFLLLTCRSTSWTNTVCCENMLFRISQMVDQYIYLTAPSDGSGSSQKVMLEIAILPAILLVALKSQDQNVRSHAIEQLEEMDSLEGFRQSKTFANCARAVVEMEEEQAKYISSNATRSHQFHVPQTFRFLDVVIAASPGRHPYKVEIVCSTLQAQRDNEIEICRYEGGGSRLSFAAVD